MPRNFATRFHRVILGTGFPLADPPPPTAMPMFDMWPVRSDERREPSKRIQTYFASTVLGYTLDMRLYIQAGDGSLDWIEVGMPLLAVPANRLVFLAGQIEDSMAYIRLTGAAMAIGQQADLYCEEAE